MKRYLNVLYNITILIISITLVSAGTSAAALKKAPVHESAAVNVRVKDVAQIQGTNSNQLVGYGIVTGLKGTGDRTKTISNVMLKNMFENMGMKLDAKELNQLQTKNTAVVTITAELPPSFRSGDEIDVTVASMGDATSVDGGVLVLSMLKGPDGKTYASAQGPLVVGLDEATKNKAKTLVGRIPGGGIISRDMDACLVRDGKMTWVLKNPDFNTVTRIVDAINKHFHATVATPNGDKFVVVDMSLATVDPATTAARIGNLNITPDSVARVIVNERTGTVVMGGDIKVLPVSISHGALSLNVGKTGNQGLAAAPAEPAPPAKAGAPAIQAKNASAGAKNERIFKMGGDATVKDVIDILNYIGASPNDIITILQALKNAGALQGELEVI